MIDHIYYLSYPMLITEKTLTHWINHFYGYGSWHARIWFIAYEEGGGDLPEEVAAKLNYFYNVHGSATHATLCDIRNLYRHVPWAGSRAVSPSTLSAPSTSSETDEVRRGKAEFVTNLYEYRFGTHAIQHGVWKNLTAFVHGYRNQTLPDLLAYQKDVFASSSAHNEALIKLYPLPSPHNHAWYYSWLDLPQLPFLKSRKLYQEYAYQRRIHTILSKLIEYMPEVVLMYGMDNINVLKKSFQEFFPGSKFKMLKATKQQIPQYHRADLNGTVILVTTQIPALRHNRIETGFDWREFGKRAESANQ